MISSLGISSASVVPGSSVLRITTRCGVTLRRSAPPISAQALSTCDESRLPLGRLGVPTQTSETSEFSTAWPASVVAESRPLRTPSSMSASISGSMIGAWPPLMQSTFCGLMSTPITVWPEAARQPADTAPT